MRAVINITVDMVMCLALKYFMLPLIPYLSSSSSISFLIPIKSGLLKCNLHRIKSVYFKYTLAKSYVYCNVFLTANSSLATLYSRSLLLGLGNCCSVYCYYHFVFYRMLSVNEILQDIVFCVLCLSALSLSWPLEFLGSSNPLAPSSPVAGKIGTCY